MGTLVNQTGQAVRLVRELKGASLSILVALAFIKQPVEQDWLERATGYTDKTVVQALLYLSETGFVERAEEGWQVNRATRELFALLSGGAQSADRKSTGRPSVLDLRRNNSASTAAAVNFNLPQKSKSSSSSRN